MKRLFASLFFGLFILFSSGNASGEVLRVGTNAEFEPFEYVSSTGIVDQFDGFDIALIKAIADDLGMKLQLETMEFDSLIMALKGGKIDVSISGMTITKTRSRAVNFTKPYFKAKQVMVVPNNSSIKKVSDMKGKRVVVMQGFTGEVVVKKLGYPYESFKKSADAIFELKNGKCDVVVMDYVVALHFCKDIKELKMIEDDDAFGVEEYGIAVSKNNPQLLKKIDASLEKMQKSGVVDTLLKKYIQ